MTIAFELVDTPREHAMIKVIGIGGGGSNAVQHMIVSGIDGVEFICANTDAQALKNTSARTVIQLGAGITKGLGAGANPDVGRDSALEDRERIKQVLHGADMLFITAGMGGGTGTGAAPVVAQIAKDLGILTVAVVTKPFPFEMKRRMGVAEQGIRELREHVDSLVIIPNEKLLTRLGRVTLLDAFREANNVLLDAVQGISELIVRPGLINVDFADVKTVMSNMGLAVMGLGSSKGEDRAREAAKSAISSPLLEDIDLHGARGVLVNITAGENISIEEFNEVGSEIASFAAEDAVVVIGTSIDPALKEELFVTIVATGLGMQAEALTELTLVKGSAKQNASDTPDYRKYDKPAVMRQQTNKPPAAPTNAYDDSQRDDVDYLDIPAFLRRQAD